MKKSFALCLLLFICLFTACDKEATVASIDGEFKTSDSVNASEVVGVQVYLHQSLGIFVRDIVDSVATSQDLTFSFDDVPFGLYMISLGDGLTIDPDTIIIELDEDNSHEALEFTVSRILE